MGRIVDLCGEVAAEAEEGPEGLVLPPEVWDRLTQEWTSDEVDDALALVHDSLVHAELIESADSLNGRLTEFLGGFGEEAAFRDAEAGRAVITLEVVGQLARRVAHLEEVLDAVRDGAPPERSGFEALVRRLADYGIEEEMRGETGLEGEDRGEDDED